MAHFLEHMAFNGTKMWPGTSLVEWFQEHGMSFGPDTNAGTSFSETVYEIDLPKSDPASIAEGLSVFRGFVGDMLLDPAEVEDEKGVIDAEERERDSPGWRMVQGAWRIELAGTRIPERIPIGVREVRHAFTADAVRRFYHRWYRPEELTLVLVGDFGELDPVPLVEKAFADVRSPAAPVLAEPPVGTPTLAQRFYAVHEPDASSVSISIERVRPWETRPDDLEGIRKDLPVDFARRMLDLRFHELAKEEGAPFLSASTASLHDNGLRAEDGEELSIRCTKETWADALAACSLELRRALELGFEEAELAEVRADALRGLDESVDRERTRSSRAWAAELVYAAEERHVPMAAEDERRIRRPMVESLDVEACRRAFAEAWGAGEWVVSVSGDVDLGPEAARVVREAWEASLQAPVEAREREEDAPFAYASDPDHRGAIASRTHDDEFDLEEVVFGNGVRLHVKKTDFKEKQVLAYALVGDGVLSLDPDDAALEIAAPAVLVGGGLGAHDADQVRRLTAGRTVGVGFSVDDDAFSLGGSTTQEDLQLQCELMRAYLVDPGWREEGLRQLEKQVPVMFESFRHQPQGPITLSFLPELYSGDARRTFPSREALEALTVADVRAWLEPSLADAPIDLVMIGDLDTDTAVDAAARTFGTLPERRETTPREDRLRPARIVQGLERSYEVDTEVPKTFVFVAYPVPDGRDVATRRRMVFLGRVLADRLRVEVREKLGAAYSPSAGYRGSETVPDDGILGIQAMAEPDKADELVQASLAVAERLAQEGLTEEEVERQRKPIQAEVRERLRTNGYWLQALSGLHEGRDVRSEMRSYPTFADSVGTADLDPLAEEYLARGRASVATVAPRAE